jgi:hypothetical protein
MIDMEIMKKEAGNEFSRTMRVHYLVYDELKRLKLMYAKLEGNSKASFSDFLAQCCYLGELLMTGQEMYEANGQLFNDIETARGEAIRASLKTKQPAQAPTIMVKLGQDPLLQEAI